jgi:adenylyltransferase/sulfurtransferase
VSDEVLHIDGEDRYSRLRLIAWWEQEKLAAARVLVVGAGALGNEVLKNLAMLGVGTIYVVDFDEIEQSNLTRSILFRARDRGRAKAEVAAEAIRDINPDVRVRPMLSNIITDVGLGLFADVDVVIGCLDNREARLWVNRCCWKVSTPWIDGGIQEINGVAKVFVPPESACYECVMTENDYRLINLRYSCPLLRQEDLLAGKVPTASTIASMIGGLQTQEALKLIHGLPVQAGAAMIYNGLANNFYTTQFPRREECLSHETYPAPIELPLSNTNSAAELFAAARAPLAGDGPLAIQLERDLVVSLEFPDGSSRRVMRPRQAVSMKESIDAKSGQFARPEMLHTVLEDSPQGSEPLAALGIAPYDVVRVTSPSAEAFFLLAGDRESSMAAQ